MTDLDTLIRHAKALAPATCVPEPARGSAPDVLFLIELGESLGLAPTQAIAGIRIIDGTPTLTPDLMAAVIRRAGHLLRVTEDPDTQTVTATVTRRDDPDHPVTATWGPHDAQLAGLSWHPGPWTQHHRQILRSRAVSEVCRTAAPDALAGITHAPDNLTPPTTVPAPTAPPPQAAPALAADEPVVMTPAEPEASAEPGPDEVLSGLWLSVLEVARAHSDSHGGSARDLVARFADDGGPADPEAFRRWLGSATQDSEAPAGEQGQEGLA